MTLCALILLSGGPGFVPFVDDGETKTHPIRPYLLDLKPFGGAPSALLRVGSRATRVWVRSAGSGIKIFVDRNGNGKLDPSDAVNLQTQSTNLPDGARLMGYQGEVTLPGSVPAKFGLRFLVSNTKDPGFAAVRNRLMVMPEFGIVGTASFGGRRMRVAARGGDLEHGVLFVDRDGDGRFGTVAAEAFAMKRPFAIGGKSYRVQSYLSGGRPTLTIGSSSQKVAEVPMPPDLRIGKVAPSLTSRTLGGKPVRFPQDFRGKVVLMDVWATWCGPCRAEIPFLKSAYRQYKGRGLEVVSFSIDDPGTQARVAAFTKGEGEPWTQLFEGKGWQSPICQTYYIQAIPFFLLVDGNTGRILARGDSLRGPSMAPTIGAALAGLRR